MSIPRGKATIALVVGAALVVSVALLWRGLSEKAAAAAAGGLLDDPGAVLVRVGFSPDDLSAAGVRSASVADVVRDVEDDLAANPGIVADADARVLAARDEAHRLERLVRGGLGSSDDVRACTAARVEGHASRGTRRGARVEGHASSGTRRARRGQRGTDRSARGDLHGGERFPE